MLLSRRNILAAPAIIPITHLMRLSRAPLYVRPVRILFSGLGRSDLFKLESAIYSPEWNEITIGGTTYHLPLYTEGRIYASRG